MTARQSNHDFRSLVANLMKARFPYLYVQTWEEDRVLSVLRSVAQDAQLIKTPREVLTWTVTSGLLDGKRRALGDTKAPLKALEYIERYDRPCIAVLQDFHIYMGASNRPADVQVIRKLRDMLLPIKQSANPVNIVFISPFLTLPEELQKDITIVDFTLPAFDEIKASLEELIYFNEKSGKIRIDLNDDGKKHLTTAALGLTLSEAENAFARAMVERGRLTVEESEIILEEKEQIIKKTEILEFIRSDLKIQDVGGLDNLKRWLVKRNKSWSDNAQQYGLPSPKGVLITGVPGCGKSLISKSISSMWQLPLLRLDMGKIFSGLVGSSEENMRKAIRTAEAISPSVLWIDEIEKGFGGISGGGDGGTAARVFGQFLTWLQEKTSPVFVVATANRIQSLPPELIRKGRFDEIFFVDLPTAKERKEILRLHINKRLKNREARGDFELTENILENLSDKCEGFVGAEIEQLVIDALFEAYAQSRSIAIGDFEKAIVNTVPLSVTQAEQIRAVREWANVRAVAATPQEDRVEYKRSEDAPSGPSDQESELPFKLPAASSSGPVIEEDIIKMRGGRTIDF